MHLHLRIPVTPEVWRSHIEYPTPEHPLIEYAVVSGEDLGESEAAIVHVPTETVVWADTNLGPTFAAEVGHAVAVLVELDERFQQMMEQQGN